MVSEGMTPADIAAVTGNNGGMGNWGDGWWILLLLLFAGGRGFGWGGGGSSCATQADLAAGFNNSTVLSSLDDIKLGQANAINYNNQGFSGLNNAIQQGFHGVDNALCTLGYNMQNCCCETQRLIERGFCDTNNSLHNVSRDIIDNNNANTRAVLDFLVKDKIDTLTAENQNLKLAASQAKQNTYLIDQLKPCPVPAYTVSNPWASFYGCNCG